MPVGWETHSAPAMGDRPQAIINKQVLKGCDLLIGIFWTRLGTLTGRDGSGTVEEINEHRQSGKPAMLYFSSVPVRQDSVDPEQYERVKTFKKQCEAEGLIATYNALDEFKDLLTRHLIKTVSDDEYFKKIVSGFTDSAILATAPDTRLEGQLSSEARNLLLEAVQDRTGSILKVMSSSGLTIRTNNKNLVTEPKDPKCQAVWESALDELVENELVADGGSEGEVFRVTLHGYEVADSLKGTA